jgi:hypothetical protein
VRFLTFAIAIALGGCSGADADFVVAEADTAIEDSSVAEAAPTDTATLDTSVPDDSTAIDSSEADTTVIEDVLPEVPADSSVAEVETETAADAPGDTAVDDAAIDDAAIDAPAEAGDDASADSPACDAKVSCWTDKDGDGYAVAGPALVACSCPPGTASRDPAVVIDCNDENPAVHPGALVFHDSPYCVPGTGCATQSFDYDCSGAEEPLHGSTFAGCGAKSAGCPGTGWTGGVPACGSNGTYVTCKASLLTCDMSSAFMTQLCR